MVLWSFHSTIFPLEDVTTELLSWEGPPVTWRLGSVLPSLHSLTQKNPVTALWDFQTHALANEGFLAFFTFMKRITCCRSLPVMALLSKLYPPSSECFFILEISPQTSLFGGRAEPSVKWDSAGTSDTSAEPYCLSSGPLSEIWSLSLRLFLSNLLPHPLNLGCLGTRSDSVNVEASPTPPTTSERSPETSMPVSSRLTEKDEGRCWSNTKNQMMKGEIGLKARLSLWQEIRQILLLPFSLSAHDPRGHRF